jgi:hypothetical protein
MVLVGLGPFNHGINLVRYESVGLPVHLGRGLPAGRLRTSPVAVFVRVTIPLMKARPTKPWKSVIEEGGDRLTSTRISALSLGSNKGGDDPIVVNLADAVISDV